MTIHHPTAAEQARKAKELKEKFYGRPAPVNGASSPDRIALADAKRTIKQQEARIAEMTATISALQAMVVEDLRREGMKKVSDDCAAPDPMRIINAVLNERHPGITFAHVIGKSQTTPCVSARRDCATAVKDRLPWMSLSELARLFMKDRSTISNLLKKKERGE